MNTAISSRPLTVERTIRASVAETWTAWSEPELVRRWFAPGEMQADVREYDVRPGGRYRICMRGGDDSVHTVIGEFIDVIPQEKLVMRWAWEGDESTVSTVTVRFESYDGGTRINILHENLTSEESAGKHADGWHGCLDNLRDRIGSF